MYFSAPAVNYKIKCNVIIGQHIVILEKSMLCVIVAAWYLKTNWQTITAVHKHIKEVLTF